MAKDKKYCRSPLFYVGDKYRLLKDIIPLFPKEINKFIEPFTGGGSVFLNTNAKKYILNDINDKVIQLHRLFIAYSEKPWAFFETIKDYIFRYGLSRSYIEDIAPTELKKQYKKTYYSKFNRNAYNQLRSDYNNEKQKDMFKLYLLIIYGFNRMIRFNSDGEYNVPVGNVDFNKNVYKSLKNYFAFVKNNEMRLYSLDFFDFLGSIELGKNDFIYLDPPYLLADSEYNKLWDVSEEERLLKLLDDLDKKGVKFAFSNVTRYKGKVNNAFLEWSSKHIKHKIKSNYISYHDNRNKSFDEVLLTNYTPPNKNNIPYQLKLNYT